MKTIKINQTLQAVLIAAAQAAHGTVPIRCSYRSQISVDGLSKLREDSQESMDRDAKKAKLREWLAGLTPESTASSEITKITDFDPQMPGEFWMEWHDLTNLWCEHCPATGVEDTTDAPPRKAVHTGNAMIDGWLNA